MCGKTGQTTAEARISTAILLRLSKVTARCCINCKSGYAGYRRRKMCEKKCTFAGQGVSRGGHECVYFAGNRSKSLNRI